jgi:hypothetical protein
MSRTLALMIRCSSRASVLIRTGPRTDPPRGSVNCRDGDHPRIPSNHTQVLAGGQWPLSCCSAHMDQIELHVRTRLLMASGELPPGPPLADKILPAQVARLTRIVIGRVTRGPCLICDEPAPTVSYTYADRKVIRLHAACDAVWQQQAT